MMTAGSIMRAWIKPKIKTIGWVRWKMSAKFGRINPNETEAAMDINVPISTGNPTERRASIMRSRISCLPENKNEWPSSKLKFKDMMIGAKRDGKAI